jgi:hypothetical protein
VHLFLYGVDLIRGVFDLMEQRVLDLWLTSPGIDFRKAVDIAGWFHCHFFRKLQRSGVQDKGRKQRK